MNKVELLLLVGGFEEFVVVIKVGVDSVYVGVKEFLVRVYVKNFLEDELRKVIDFCYERVKKIYFVINILVYNDEMYKVLKFVEFVYKEGIDVVIV